MEVLRRGYPLADASADFTCHGCHSLLRARFAEGRRVNDQRDGDAVVFTCPVCHQEVWVALQVFSRASPALVPLTTDHPHRTRP